MQILQNIYESLMKRRTQNGDINFHYKNRLTVVRKH